MILETITVLSIATVPAAFWAGHEWGKRRYRVPVRRESHTDEFLYRNDAGEFVPYQPPQYVPEGQNPVAATWEKNRQTGRQHHTRRVESSAHLEPISLSVPAFDKSEKPFYRFEWPIRKRGAPKGN